MANKIKLKSSVVPGKVPLTTDLDIGEIAINSEDGKLYIAKTTSGTVTSVVEIGAGGGGSYDPAAVAITGGSVNGVTLNGLTVSQSGSNEIVIGTNTTGNGANTTTIGNTAIITTYIAGELRVGASQIKVGRGNGDDSSNFAIGANALDSIVPNSSTGAGQYNTALGMGALEFNVSGGQNCAIGQGTLTNCQGSFNLALGNGASQYLLNVNGTTAIGSFALGETLLSANNTAIGGLCMYHWGGSTTPDKCVVGVTYKILDAGTTTTWTSMGSANNSLNTTFVCTAPGSGDGNCAPTIAERNTVVGASAMPGSSTQTGTGGKNTFVGYSSGSANLFGNFNTGVGSGPLSQLVSGSYNTSFGRSAMGSSGAKIAASAIIAGRAYTIIDIGTTDFTAIGAANNYVGIRFTASGAGSGTGHAAANADQNTAIGHQAGYSNSISSTTGGSTTGANNVFLGACTIPASGHDDNSIVIGTYAVGLGSNTAVIGNSSITSVTAQGRLIIKGAAPGSSVGAGGDKAGMICADNDYVYYATADYDGTTSIWKRLSQGATW